MDPAHGHGEPQGDRTTLVDVNGGTTTTPSAACDQYPGGLHTSLLVYAGIGCEEGTTTGAWNSFTGSSNGWQEVAFDLAPYAGSQGRVSFSYVTDGGVTIATPLNVPSSMAEHASQLYGRNVLSLLELMTGENGALELDFEDEVIAGACITRGGEIVHEGAKAAAGQPA